MCSVCMLSGRGLKVHRMLQAARAASGHHSRCKACFLLYRSRAEKAAAAPPAAAVPQASVKPQAPGAARADVSPPTASRPPAATATQV